MLAAYTGFPVISFGRQAVDSAPFLKTAEWLDASRQADALKYGSVFMSSYDMRPRTSSELTQFICTFRYWPW